MKPKNGESPKIPSRLSWLRSRRAIQREVLSRSYEARGKCEDIRELLDSIRTNADIQRLTPDSDETDEVESPFGVDPVETDEQVVGRLQKKVATCLAMLGPATNAIARIEPLLGANVGMAETERHLLSKIVAAIPAHRALSTCLADLSMLVEEKLGDDPDYWRGLRRDDLDDFDVGLIVGDARAICHHVSWSFDLSVVALLLAGRMADEEPARTVRGSRHAERGGDRSRTVGSGPSAITRCKSAGERASKKGRNR